MTSHKPAFRPLRTKPRHSGIQTNFTVAPNSVATSWETRFSNPLARSFENGMLFGSAQTLSSRDAAGDDASAVNIIAETAATEQLRKRENIERASLGCRVRKIFHRIHEA